MSGTGPLPVPLPRHPRVPPVGGSRSRGATCATTTVCIVSLLGAGAACAASAEAGGLVDAARPPVVCVSPCVRCESSTRELELMLAEMQRIWRMNGVDLVFPDLVTGAPCRQPAARAVLLFVVDGEQHLPSGIHVPASAIGATASDGRKPVPIICVMAGRARQWASGLSHVQQDRCLLWRFLGRVAAHELGHVLLQTAAHRLGGLMRPGFDQRDLRPADDHAYLLGSRDREVVANLADATPAPTRE